MRLLWEQEVGGSNPLAPKSPKVISEILFALRCHAAGVAFGTTRSLRSLGFAKRLSRHFHGRFGRAVRFAAGWFCQGLIYPSAALASASAARCASVTSGYFSLSRFSARFSAATTMRRVNHLLSAGTTYQGDSGVAVAVMACS